jgi:hypothetical protein
VFVGAGGTHMPELHCHAPQSEVVLQRLLQTPLLPLMKQTTPCSSCQGKLPKHRASPI